MNNQYDIAPEKLQRRQLTARNLEDFRLCPHKYLLSLLLTPADSRKFLGGPAALQRATRAALVECYRDGGPQQVPLDSLLELFEQDWEGRLCSDSLEEAQLHARGVDVLTAYHHAHHDQPNQTIAVALRLAGEIEGFSFVAVADRVDRDESGHHAAPLQISQQDARTRRAGERHLRRIAAASWHYALRPTALSERHLRPPAGPVDGGRD